MPTIRDRLVGLRLRDMREQRGLAASGAAGHARRGDAALMKPLPPDRERELIRLADQVNALDLTGLNPI